MNPEKYKGIVSGFRTTVAEEGFRALGKGWAPTAIGYSMQGLGKFGFYELFKVVYADAIGEVRVMNFQFIGIFTYIFFIGACLRMAHNPLPRCLCVG